MARTNLNAVENTEPVNTGHTTILPSGETITEWFLRGARQAGLYVTADGRVVGQNDTYAFVVPPPACFEDVAAFFVYSLVKNAEYRIGQHKGGDLTAETTKFSESLGSWKPGRSADSSTPIFMQEVEATVRSRIVDDAGNPIGDSKDITPKTLLRKAVGDDGKTVMRLVLGAKQKGDFTLAKAIDLIATKSAAHRDRIIEEAIERGRNKPAGDKPAGPGRGHGRTADEPDLGDIDLT